MTHNTEGHLHFLVGERLASRALQKRMLIMFTLCTVTLTSINRCMLPSGRQHSWYSRKKIVTNETADNKVCGLSWVTMMSGKKHHYWVYPLYLLVLWAPYAECHPVPVYSREGKHRFSWYLQNLLMHTKQSRWIHSTTGRRENKYFWSFRSNVSLRISG